MSILFVIEFVVCSTEFHCARILWTVSPCILHIPFTSVPLQKHLKRRKPRLIQNSYFLSSYGYLAGYQENEKGGTPKQASHNQMTKRTGYNLARESNQAPRKRYPTRFMRNFFQSAFPLSWDLEQAWPSAVSTDNHFTKKMNFIIVIKIGPLAYT